MFGGADADVPAFRLLPYTFRCAARGRNASSPRLPVDLGDAGDTNPAGPTSSTTGPSTPF